MCCFFYAKTTTPQPLQAFKSDGCSLFPNGSWSQPQAWCHCCVRHDLAYWQGGTATQRQQADAKLAICVQKSGFSATSKLMYAGVRMGGSPFLPTSYRWGYGWAYGRTYQSLSKLEAKQRDTLLEPDKERRQYQHHCE